MNFWTVVTEFKNWPKVYITNYSLKKRVSPLLFSNLGRGLRKIHTKFEVEVKKCDLTLVTYSYRL